MLYTKCFTDKNGRMAMDHFRAICEAVDYDPEQVLCLAEKLGYSFQNILGLELIDLIGFEFPYEIYDVRN